jgi:hypothetical protein
MHRVKFLIIKPSRCTNFSNLFLEWNSTCFGQFLCPSLGLFFTVHTSSILILLASCQQTCMAYTIAVCVQWKTPDDGQRNCPKHVEFHSRNKSEKLVHLVGFIIRKEKHVPLYLLSLLPLLGWEQSIWCVRAWVSHLTQIFVAQWIFWLQFSDCCSRRARNCWPDCHFWRGTSFLNSEHRTHSCVTCLLLEVLNMSEVSGSSCRPRGDTYCSNCNLAVRNK